jgi:tellurite resistance protein
MPWYLSQPFNASFWSFPLAYRPWQPRVCIWDKAVRGFHAIAVPLFIFTNALLVRT